MRARFVLPLVLVVMLAAAASASGQVVVGSVRCDGGVIGVGSAPAAVLRACGQPDAQEHWTQPVRYGVIEIDEWTYPPTSGEMGRTIRFENRLLASIRLNR